MNGVLGYLCAHIGETVPGKPPEDGEINEMTPPSRQRILNSEAEHATTRSRRLPTISKTDDTKK